MAYILELKQILAFQRCRMYRHLIHGLLSNQDIRTHGEGLLFYYIVLCNFANYRYSYRRIEGRQHTLCPGEWMCSDSEIRDWFRVPSKAAAFDILDRLAEKGFIRYKCPSWAPGFIHYEIRDWADYNTAIPVVYFRRGAGSPLLSYAELSERWHISKSTAGRLVRKLAALGYIHLISDGTKRGTAIYLTRYLSTIFGVQDTPVHEQEIMEDLNLTVAVSEPVPEIEPDNVIVTNGSDPQISVPKSGAEIFLAQIGKSLARRGFHCAGCEKATYILSKLSACGGGKYTHQLLLRCQDEKAQFRFVLRLI